LEGGAGADQLFGSDGYDFASYAQSTAGVAIDLATSTASGGEAQDDTLYSIEGVVGSAKVDELYGDALDHQLKGNGGDDEMVAGSGNDRIDGGNASDYMDGDFGKDRIGGGAGNDVLVGYAGADRMTGGTGADRFHYISRLDSPLDQRDTIVDFKRNDGDKFDLRFVDAIGGGSEVESFGFVGKSVFTAAAQLRFEQRDGTTFVQLNTDADLAAEQEIGITGLIDLKATDFLL
jgi:Ca2+-binding RTX toxin-like protein